MFAPIPGVAVIGFGHRARSGKDTAAAAIVKTIDGAQRFSFADDLYAVARVMYGMTTKDAPLLQRIGVEARNTDPDVWIRSVYFKIVEARPRLAVIPDVRFPNEMAFVKALGGITIKMSRFNADGTLFVDPSRPADHISETALQDAEWDHVIQAESGDTWTVGRQAEWYARALLHDEVPA